MALWKSNFRCDMMLLRAKVALKNIYNLKELCWRGEIKVLLFLHERGKSVRNFKLITLLRGWNDKGLRSRMIFNSLIHAMWIFQ